MKTIFIEPNEFGTYVMMLGEVSEMISKAITKADTETFEVNYILFSKTLRGIHGVDNKVALIDYKDGKWCATLIDGKYTEQWVSDRLIIID